MKKIKRVILDRLLPRSVAGQLRTWRLHRNLRKYPVRVVEHVYGSTKLKVFVSDALAEGWYDHDWDQLPEIVALRPYLRPDGTVFDFGAHQGVVAMMICRELGPLGKVVAVEPNAHNVAALRRNRDLNGCQQLQILHAAVSSKTGSITFNENLNGQLDDGTAVWGKTTVDAVTVDQLAVEIGMPDVVFIDVEGAECLALAGASQVLRSNACFFVEVHVGAGLEKLGGSVAEVLSHFSADRHTLLARAEGDAVFRPFHEEDGLTADRFFLLAIPG